MQFSNDIPNIYHGEESKDAVMEWLVKVSSIEFIKNNNKCTAARK